MRLSSLLLLQLRVKRSCKATKSDRSLYSFEQQGFILIVIHVDFLTLGPTRPGQAWLDLKAEALRSSSCAWSNFFRFKKDSNHSSIHPSVRPPSIMRLGIPSSMNRPSYQISSSAINESLDRSIAQRSKPFSSDCLWFLEPCGGAIRWKQKKRRKNFQTPQWSWWNER